MIYLINAYVVLPVLYTCNMCFGQIQMLSIETAGPSPGNGLS